MKSISLMEYYLLVKVYYVWLQDWKYHYETPFLKRLTLNLKLVSTIFCQIFIFSPNDSPSKIVKNKFYFT